MTRDEMARNLMTLAVADCIRAAGFEGLAKQYRDEPAYRGRILANAFLRREMVRAVGELKAARLFEIAEEAT